MIGHTATSLRRLVGRMSPLAALLAVVLTLGACSPTYQLQAPAEFTRFEKADGHKLITADGVRLKIREVDNYPKATLAFWTDAMRRHLAKRGYRFMAENCFKTDAGLPGCSLDFGIPRGAEDWVFSQTVFVADERVVLIEVAGPYSRFAPLAKRLRESFKTFGFGD